MCVGGRGGGRGFALQAVIKLQEKQLIGLHYKIVQLSMSIMQALAAITLATTFFSTLLSLLESSYTDRSSVG